MIHFPVEQANIAPEQMEAPQKRSRSDDTAGQDMQSFLDQFSVQETHIAPCVSSKIEMHWNNSNKMLHL